MAPPQSLRPVGVGRGAAVKLDVALATEGWVLHTTPTLARTAEALGFGALWAPEAQHNPFLPLVLAAEHTERLQIGTAVAIAFARSPMAVAQAAWDLQSLSGGRMLLGLGTQVKAHIERRFAMPWSSPAARLRDYIGALRAIWAAWQGDGRLDYRGPFYQHTLMAPFFNPGPIAHPHIPISVAGVNTGLATVAGEAADGFQVHPFHSAAYIGEVIRPAIEGGAAQTARSLASFEMIASVFVITGEDAAATERTRAQVRSQIAFYASTPTYRPVLAHHGWARTGEQLSRLAATRRWADMPALITDEMLTVFTVEAPPHQIGQALRARYTGLLDRITLYLPFVPGQYDDLWRATIGNLASKS
jgi:probable F420-dependent oxidoreductase